MNDKRDIIGVVIQRDVSRVIRGRIRCRRSKGSDCLYGPLYGVVIMGDHVDDDFALRSES